MLDKGLSVRTLIHLDFHELQSRCSATTFTGSNPTRVHMEDNRSLDEIYEAICNRIRERYAEQGVETSDDEVKKAADNLIRFCNRLADINTD